jgi:hypothetical protein
MTENDFLADVVSKCLDNEIDIKLFNKRSHMGCGGWFVDTELVACIKRPDRLEILAHEAAHMDQFLENDPLWLHPYINDVDMWDAEYAKKHPKKHMWAVKKTSELEIDCNIRAVDKIKRYNLDIDLPSYIKAANCYHAAYYYFHKYKAFYKVKKEPYNVPAICDTFPDDRILSLKEVWKPHKLLGEHLKIHNKPF